MAHLYKFRQGWQSENLARFLLSELSFIAQPSTVADDVGSDFYCTLFEKEKAGRNIRLLPKNSFVIQIKSSAKPIDLSDKGRFLKQMELPYFIGVVNRKKLSLQVYSGRALHLLFSMKGVPKTLIAKCTPPMQDKAYYRIVDEGHKHYELKFPLLGQISVANLEREAIQLSSQLVNECALIHQNISSRRMGEYILTFAPDDVRIIAGSGSAQQFRRNFCARMAEAFYNLEWILQSAASQFSNAEYSAYQEAWVRIRPHCSAGDQAFVDQIYNRLSQAVAARSN